MKRKELKMNKKYDLTEATMLALQEEEYNYKHYKDVNRECSKTESIVNTLHNQNKITESVDWSYYNKFKNILDKYMSNSGEGETMASQIVTAINKLIYKWYNDGDVYDNVNSGMQGWANDLSDYANWLDKYCKPASQILDSIYNCSNDDEYENILKALADKCLDEKYLSTMEEKPKQGSIYDCEGQYEFSEYNEEDDYDYDYNDEDNDDYEEDDDEEYLDSIDESKELKKEDYTARERFDSVMKKYVDNGGERSTDDITVLAETDNFLLAGSRDEERPTMIHLDVWTGSYDSVEVFIDQDYKGRVQSAKINWSAIGSVGIEETEEFINHLNDAIEFVKQIDGKDFSDEL